MYCMYMYLAFESAASVPSHEKGTEKLQTRSMMAKNCRRRRFWDCK
jgi:hypothetical protein